MCICRVLVSSSRKLAQQYKLTYQEEIPTAQLVQRIANVMQEYTQQGWERVIIIIIPRQCLWCCHHAWSIARVHLVHAMSAARRQVAANLWTKPIGLNHKLACRLPVNYTHHRHFIITQPESRYSFYHPTEGRRLSRPSWLATYRDGSPAHTVIHPSTNRTRRRVTSLIETNALPLSHATRSLSVASHYKINNFIG